MFRFALEKKSLRMWLNFDWMDFQDLQAIYKTFKVRHLPLSTERAWAGSSLVKSPKLWGKKTRNRSQKKAARPAMSSFAVVADNTPVITIWDSDEEGLAGPPKPPSPPAKKSTKRKRNIRKPKALKKTRTSGPEGGDDTVEDKVDDQVKEGNNDDAEKEGDGDTEDDDSSWSALDDSSSTEDGTA